MEKFLEFNKQLTPQTCMIRGFNPVGADFSNKSVIKDIKEIIALVGIKPDNIHVRIQRKRILCLVTFITHDEMAKLDRLNAALISAKWAAALAPARLDIEIAKELIKKSIRI